MKKIFLCVILFITALSVKAEDSNLWLSLSHEHEIYKKFYIEFEAELRFENEMSTLYQTLVNFGLAYEINDYFKLSTAYRARAYDYASLQDEFLLNGYFEFDIIKNLEFDLRLRYNKRWRDERDDKEYIRPRFGLNYEITKRYKPFFEVEGLYRINDDKSDRFEELRYNLGLSIDLPNKIEFDIYYGYHTEINLKNTINSHVLGIAWKFDNDL